MRPLLPVLLLLGLLVGCTSDEVAPASDDAPTTPPVSATPTEPVSAEVEVLVEGLQGPTQVASHPDGRVVVAVLGAGGEGASTGQVVALDLDDPDDREVLVEGLETPTGVTVAGEELWIMEPTRLLRAPLAGGQAEVVLDGMPNNGRSNGTIRTLDDGRLLFDTAGRRAGSEAAPDSGTLWLLDPTSSFGSTVVGEVADPVLTGMKHAYAAVPLGEDRLAVTEMSDGRYDGQPAPDEVVVIGLEEQPVPTGGWPRCIGDREPVEEYDGTPALCRDAVSSTALFEPGATPTGITVTPDGTVLVALWNRDQVVAVDLEAGDPSTAVTVVTEQIANPQHLLVHQRRVLVTGHAEGTIVALDCCR